MLTDAYNNCGSGLSGQHGTLTPPPLDDDELDDDELDDDELDDDELDDDELDDDELDDDELELDALLDELDGPGRWEEAQLLGDGLRPQHGEQLISYTVVVDIFAFRMGW